MCDWGKVQVSVYCWVVGVGGGGGRFASGHFEQVSLVWQSLKDMWALLGR